MDPAFKLRCVVELRSVQHLQYLLQGQMRLLFAAFVHFLRQAIPSVFSMNLADVVFA